MKSSASKLLIKLSIHIIKAVLWQVDSFKYIMGDMQWTVIWLISSQILSKRTPTSPVAFEYCKVLPNGINHKMKRWGGQGDYSVVAGCSFGCNYQIDVCSRRAGVIVVIVVHRFRKSESANEQIITLFSSMPIFIDLPLYKSIYHCYPLNNR